MNNDLSPYTGTQAVLRALAVLQAFGPDAATRTPQDISRRTGLNRSTVYRLVSALEEAGMVAPDGSGGYRLGPALITLGELALRQTDLRVVALPLMHALAQHTGETVDLEVLRGADVVIIEEVAGEHLLSANSFVGTDYPAHCTATGKLLLAYAPDALRERVLGGALGARGPHSITDAARLRDAFARAKAQGYATAYEELEAHLHAIAAPIFDHRGQAVAALSVSGPAARLPRSREQQYAQLVVAACNAISQQLGAPTTGLEIRDQGSGIRISQEPKTENM